MGHLLSVDLGTSSVKVLLVDREGRALGSGNAEYPIHGPQAGWAEQDPEAWWQATVAAVRQVAAAEVDVIGLSGQMHGTVLLGDGDRVLAPAIIWPDQRSTRQVREITQFIGAERLTELTGSPVATGFQAATIRWVQQERPELWRQVRKILLPKDFLRWRLTEQYATDPSDGSGALLLDVQRRDWSRPLLDALEIPLEQLPPVQPSSAVAGELTSAAAQQLGLDSGIPVITGAADTACSMLGAGVVSNDTLLLTISTGGQLLLPAMNVHVDQRGRIHTFASALEPSPEQAGWYQMGAILSAGMALRWLRDQVLGWQGEEAYQRMTSAAEEVPIGARGLLFLPYLVGERTPHMDPQARGVFLGLTLGHGQAELVRAVMEGVTLACSDAYSVLAELGAAPQRIVLAGGGARSRLWQQMVADVFGLPVQPLEVADQSALGAALLAGAGLGAFDAGKMAQSWARYGPPLEPNIPNQARYRELLEVYREAYQQNLHHFRKLHHLATSDV